MRGAWPEKKRGVLVSKVSKGYEMDTRVSKGVSLV